MTDESRTPPRSGPSAPPVLTLTPEDLTERARALARRPERVILGITGAPGAGKSTVARQVVQALGPDLAVLVPMDGFHLANVTLRAWGRRDRKGAWDTFDAGGFVQLLSRLRAREEDIVHAPDFDRGLDESVGSAIPVARDVPLVVTEGNYLLSSEGGWARVVDLLDESWFLEVPDRTRQERLTQRHMQHGMDEAQAQAWAEGTDQTNALTVSRGRERADLVIQVADV